MSSNGSTSNNKSIRNNSISNIIKNSQIYNDINTENIDDNNNTENIELGNDNNTGNIKRNKDNNNRNTSSSSDDNSGYSGSTDGDNNSESGGKKKIEKGDYGYARKYKNKRIIITLLCFACIMADILIGLIAFQSRKTLFTVVACVMSLPFAKNLIGYLMVVGFKPLSKSDYEKVKTFADEKKITMCYDISASDSQKMLFYPCVAIAGNNVTALINPMKGESISEESGSKNAARKDGAHMEFYKKYEKCLSQINDNEKNKVQINIVSNIGEFKNAMKRLSSENHEKSDAKKKDEKKIKNKLLVIGV
ncbi:hypothetical protein SAMN05660484_00668 [Eubacterium ruminantium]|uniref:Uncharacterized protein n=1 Tax=Eubacterium ruminantium TaxID=42322 RepID=A0A1T4M419_9FIRM|nr:hypothetical protein [Eubacterium ruminantium]SCW37343.1 hypothetical protein SAMN05660484_00668 [Eubacterium ruminantium]SDM47430.1 hypothetical protein SAMN04490370_103232 [Eubacterium ruminantium]SJZ61484.1 hypothetical protein SAMN02745110_01084 [Eubacterium ruminantium]